MTAGQRAQILVELRATPYAFAEHPLRSWRGPISTHIDDSSADDSRGRA